MRYVNIIVVSFVLQPDYALTLILGKGKLKKIKKKCVFVSQIIFLENNTIS